MIAKLRHSVPSFALTNIYKSLILPYLTYGLVAWGNTSKNYLNKVVVLQKRVLIEKNMQSPCLKMRKFCLLPSYIMKLYVNECSMFITTVHLLISWNLLRELQTSIHALLAQQRHNSIAFSTLGLICKKKPFRALVSQSGMRNSMNTKICQRNPSKKKQKELFSIF